MSTWDERKCRVCGCTDSSACEGGCYWVEENLCSECAESDVNDKHEKCEQFEIDLNPIPERATLDGENAHPGMKRR